MIITLPEEFLSLLITTHSAPFSQYTSPPTPRTITNIYPVLGTNLHEIKTVTFSASPQVINPELSLCPASQDLVI
jgi:hypothetical protein